MAKTFYTERDIDDLHACGKSSLDVDDNVVLTDLAKERVFKYEMKLNRLNQPAPLRQAPNPALVERRAEQEMLVQRVKSAVLARLDGQVDAALLDALIRRVIVEMK